MKKILSLLILLTAFTFIIRYNPFVLAQESSGYAITIPLIDSDVGGGDVICSVEDGFKKCEGEYDTSMYGVVVDESSVYLEDQELENYRLVLKEGIARVRVSVINGSIEEGDYLTSSNLPGVAQKATRNGYVLGVALEGFDPSDQDSVGFIQIVINIHPEAKFSSGGSNLLQFIRQGLSVPLLEPIASLRYLLAVLMVLISFTLGMIYFGRSSRAGIEAVGRNPLAKRVIQFTVLINIVLTIVIVLVGLGIAYLILVI